jgi:hypothetical protein
MPRGLRLFTWVLLLLSGMVSCGAAQSIGQVLDASAIEPVPASAVGPLADPEMMKAVHAMAETQLRALRGMRGSRIAIQFALSLCCGLALVSALRLLKPTDVPREAVRRLITFAATGCAILRTLDGAQLAVAYRRASFTLVEATTTLPTPLPEEVTGVILVGASAAWTAAIAGSFALLAGYFGSTRVRAWVTQADKQRT